MRSRVAAALALCCAAAYAQPVQKWVDEKGKVYYGEKPAGVKVKPAEIKGGAGPGPAPDPASQSAKPSSKGTGSRVRTPEPPPGPPKAYVPDLDAEDRAANAAARRKLDARIKIKQGQDAAARKAEADAAKKAGN